jgi:predicted ATP-dependent endonuclease of OLD family
MYISKIAINNFRLLESVELGLEEQTTVIVGRNNSGKTSLTELFRRLQEDVSPRFRLEDFSLGVLAQFWTAFELQNNGAKEELVRDTLPSIKTELTIEYGDSGTDLGPLSDFIIDLNPECTKTKVNILYALEDGKIQALFDDIEREQRVFFKAIKERIPELFKTRLEAEDPNDPTNKKELELSSLRDLLQCGFISAHRT